VIPEFRRSVAETLRLGTSAPVYEWLPDDPAHLPCTVVGRPSIREGSSPAVMTLELTVTLLGRRIADDDAQAELDALADEMFTAFGGTRQVRTRGQFLRTIALEPATASVAGLDIPAYLATIAGEAMSC
jgi:hypothetical protein